MQLHKNASSQHQQPILPHTSKMSRQLNATPITKRKEYSPHTRTRWRTEKDLGESFTDIAKKYNVSPTTVWGAYDRYPHQKSAKSSPRSGRPRKLDDRHQRHLWRTIDNDPFISVATLIETCCPHISKWTLTRWLREKGIMHQRALRRPFLTPEHAKQIGRILRLMHT